MPIVAPVTIATLFASFFAGLELRASVTLCRRYAL
jgi:hypothetical protein